MFKSFTSRFLSAIALMLLGAAAHAQVVSVSGPLTCPNANVGSSSDCGYIVMTVTTSMYYLSSTPTISLSGTNPGDFTVDYSSRTCSGGQTHFQGSACRIGHIRFNPTAAGSRQVNWNTSVGGSGTIFATGVQTYTYSWQTGNWGSCTGGSGSWSYGSWTPTSGCGSVTQTRSATCNKTPNSGTQTRSVTCRRSDGTTVSDSYCSGTKPSTTQSCTPTSDSVCGTKGATSQTVTLTNTCTYSWEYGNWGSCTGGSGTWSYGSWAPTTGCGTVTQTRSASCVANPNSGSQTRSATCRRSDGTTVSNSYCGTPVTSQSCTPTSGFSCGTQGATSQTTTLTNSCTGTASVSSVSCGSVGVGLTNSCSTVTLTASGGPIMLGSTTHTRSGDTSQFTVSTPSSNVCAANQALASGASCNLTNVTFAPTSVGAKSMTVAVAPSSGNGGSGTVTGTGVAGTASVDTSGLSCSGKVGVENTCSGSITVSASGGQIVLSSGIFSLSGAQASEFNVARTVSGACAPGQTLNNGASCKLGPVTFTAGGGGTRSATITVTPSSGTAGSATLSGSASYGTATLSVSGVSCSGTVGIASNCSGTATITATGGAVVLNATPVIKSGSHSGDFTVAAGTCAGATLSSGSSCSLGPITFTAGATGTRTVTLTTSAASGTNTSASLSGTGSAAGSATVSSVACGTAGIGTTKTCSGTMTLTATGGAIRLGSPVYTVSGATTAFTYAAATTGACTAGSVLASGQSCNLITVSAFKPTAAGAHTLTVNVSPTVGTTGSNTVSGTGVYGTVTVSTSALSCTGKVGVASTCTGEITVTATNGSVVLGSTLFSLSGSHASDFSVAASVSNACTANQTLANGASCKLGPVTFTAGGGGTRSATITVAPSSGTAGSATLSGSASYGTAALSFSGVSCSGTVGIATTCTGAGTITATNGRVVLQADPIKESGPDKDDFSVESGACAGATLQSGQSCTLGTVHFTPKAAGVRSNSFTTQVVSGTATSATLTGTASAPGTAVVSTIDCGEARVDESKPCNGNISVTATGGAIKLSATTHTLGGDTDQFAYANPSSNRCAANQVLESGQSCNLINMNRFAPTSTGAKTMTITVTPASGSVGSNTVTGIGYTYSWSIGEWSEWDSTCSENATRTRVVRCERNDGTFVDDSLCLETKPTTSDTQQVLTGCSFSWVENGFGECQGGSYHWVTGDWGPTMACGEIEQTRSVTCVIHTDSGSHSQTLGCRRSDGVMRPLSECDAQTRPVEVKACTPPESICEGAPDASRIVTLDTSCTRDSILQACERARANGQKCLVLPL